MKSHFADLRLVSRPALYLCIHWRSCVW